MNKLYTQTTVSVPYRSKINAVLENDTPWSDARFDELKDCTQGYCNAGALYDSVASESYTLVDSKNQSLYNAYACLLAEKMGVSMPQLQTVSVEALNTDGIIPVNHSIALEGWISTLWEKIKSIFKSVYQSVQAFFKKHFTRLGRAKNALENLQSVLRKTEKELSDASMENYSGGLLGRYAGYGVVNASNVKTSLANVAKVTQSIAGVNKQAQAMASAHMVDKDFFTKIKALKDQAAGNDSAKEDIDKNTPGKMSTILNGDKRRDRSAKLDESKTLGEISKQAKSEASSMDAEVGIQASNDTGDLDSNLELAKKQMAGFLDEVKKTLDVGLNTKLISGMQITEVTITDDLDLTVVMGNEEAKATALVLGARSDLLICIKTAITLLDNTEKALTQYGDTNDLIIKNLGTIDSLISDIDKIDPQAYGQYKKLVNEQVRARLQMLRKFFSVYNKTGKTLLDMSMDACEAVVEYGVLSVKHFK